MSWFKIFSAVVVGNIVSWAIIGIIGFFLSFLIMEATMKEIFGGHPTFNAPSSPAQQPSTSSNVSPRDYLAEQARQEQQRLEQIRRRQAQERTDPTVIRTNRQMCEFWTEEFRKDGSEQSRKYRDSACSRYRASLN
jgi:flagellar biosynthesis protein FliP